MPYIRPAKWWWKVRQAAPTLRANQIAELGNLSVFNDLNAYITYKPYQPTRAYARFINTNGVKPIKPKSEERNAQDGLKNTL